MFKRILWGLFWILLILEYVNAQTLDPFSIEYEVLQNRVLVHINFEVELVEETEINYLIENDAEKLLLLNSELRNKIEIKKDRTKIKLKAMNR